LCNVDADNLIPRGFASHLNTLMNRHPRAIATFGRVPGNTRGRLAVFRSDFIQVGGYDEALTGWGWDDKNLRARLRASGCRIQYLHEHYARFLAHNSRRRVENMSPEHQRQDATSDRNAAISRANLANGEIVANMDKCWGQASLLRNFKESFAVGIQSCSRTLPAHQS